MADSAAIIQSKGFDEINLNCGCPSPANQHGNHGAILMLQPKLVAQLCLSMRNSCQIPVTVKCRLGVDNNDSYSELAQFIKTVNQDSGVTKFIVHARKALLQGLNPKENRTIPDLKYDWVMKLKEDFPDISFVINGGLNTIEKVKAILDKESQLEGCMCGRLAMNTPWQLARVDTEVYGESGCEAMSKVEVLKRYQAYCEV